MTQALMRLWNSLLQFIRRRLKRFLQVLGEEEERPSPRLPERITALELGLASTDPPIYRANKSLFTDNEIVFYRALCEAAAAEYQVFAKVRMADFIWLRNEP